MSHPDGVQPIVRCRAASVPALEPSDVPFPPLTPLDEHNRALEANVHPRDWVNPAPRNRYHLVVIGGGTAGLVTAAVAANLGARVALVERALLGGDCLNVGCVPSKALLSAARVAADCRNSAAFGVHAGGVVVDFPAIMERMRRLRAEISPHDSASRFRDLGVDVFIGDGRFTGADRLEVAGKELAFRKAVIATGARAASLDVPGFVEAGCLTNETVFSLTTLPRRLVVIGGGPIGCELSQAFARFGSDVTLIHNQSRLLETEDAEAAAIVHRSLERDGVRVVLNARVTELRRRADHRFVLYEREKTSFEAHGDQVLVAVGRRPNVNGLGLEAAGVAFDDIQGVLVDDRLRTTNHRIYAAGDCCSVQKFTHAADFMARVVVQNALFYGRKRMSRLVIPRCTYTSPEVAHVGVKEEQARSEGRAIETLTIPLSRIDRAIVAGESEGFFRVHTKAGSDRILGATIVANHAGEMISEVALAMTHGLGLKALASTIHPYPTVAEGLRKLGDQYNAGRLKPWVKTLLNRWFVLWK
jgi:pyruvate/2-oxoglutarate dehydrogenase complex dihydrolipoamide dehydrogenase (E3) component